VILLVHDDGSAEVVDPLTCEALEQAVGRQLELHAAHPDLAKVTPQLGRVRGAAVSHAMRLEPTATDTRSAAVDHRGMDREWLTVAEAAETLAVSRRTIERRVAAGELRSMTLGRCRRVLRADVERGAAA
jgi:excisionase family DNA binding protein